MKRGFTATVLAVACLTSACGRSGGAAGEAATATPVGGARPQAGYGQPPVVQRVSIGHDGSVEIRGHAAHEGRVRALTAQGAAYGATTGADGAFMIDAPASGAALMVALSADDSRNVVAAPGFLFIPPEAPGRAVMLIPGAPSRAVGGGAGLITAVDYDAGGGGAVCGAAAPGQAVSVYLDGALAARTMADSAGLYAVRLGDKPISPGDHEVRVTTPGQSVSRILQFVAEAAPAGRAFAAERQDNGWRVNWTQPLGGSETTLVLTPRTPS